MMACNTLRRMNCRWLFCFHQQQTKHTNTSNEINFSSKPSSQQSDNQYCVELVRKFDYENFLATLLLPSDVQRATFALRAFHIEMAQVQDVTSDKRIAMMRIQFWKDALNKMYKQEAIPQTPISTELAGTCRHYGLSKHWLDRIVDGRASSVEVDRFNSVKNIEDHAEKINSSLYYLMLECAGIKNVQVDHAASHLGKAQGLVTVLRATPFHASRRKVYIPMETLAQHGVSQEDIVQGKTTQPVKDAIFEVASTANQHLEKARSLNKSLPKKTNIFFLNAAVCDNYLKTLQKLDFNIFDGKMQIKDHLLSFRMYANKLRGKF